MVAEKLADILKEKGCKKVAFTDLARDDMAEAIEDAFRYDKLVLAAATYDGGVFPPMEDFLNRLAHKNYQSVKLESLKTGHGLQWLEVYEIYSRRNERFNLL